MPHPILDASPYPRSLPEASELERALADNFFDTTVAINLATRAGIAGAALNSNLPPSSLWAKILDEAAGGGLLAILIERIEEQPRSDRVKKAIAGVRNVTLAGGSLQPTRLLLAGDRPFLGRTNLRTVVPEMQNWDGSASILVVRGSADTGRTETHVFLADRSGDKWVVVDEMLQLKSTMRQIWKAAGGAGDPPALTQPVTTESAELADFWTDVKECLETNDRRIWIVFDDLDKGAGRLGVQALAEVLAMRLQDVTFQKRVRLVLLGYPAAQMPDKVRPAFVREDKTDELFEEAHVQAFIEFCLIRTGKRISEDASTVAKRLCQAARDKATKAIPYSEVLNTELCAWYRGLA